MQPILVAEDDVTLRFLAKHTPVIAMTANPDKQKCLDAGMNDFVFKPVRLDELEIILKRWLAETSHDANGTKDS